MLSSKKFGFGFGLGVFALTLVVAVPNPAAVGQEARPAKKETSRVVQQGAVKTQEAALMRAPHQPADDGAQLLTIFATAQESQGSSPPLPTEAPGSPGAKTGQSPDAKKPSKIVEATPIVATKVIWEGLLHRTKELDKGVEAVSAEVEKMRPGDLAQDIKTVAALKRALTLIEAQREPLGILEPEIRALAQLYRDELAKAPAAYRRLAADYERKAKVQKFPEMAKNYLVLSEGTLRDAAMFDKELAEFDQKMAEIFAKVALAREVCKFAGVLRQHLDVAPDQEKLAQLDQFARILDNVLANSRKTFEGYRRFQDQRHGAALPGLVPYDPGIQPPAQK